MSSGARALREASPVRRAPLRPSPSGAPCLGAGGIVCRTAHVVSVPVQASHLPEDRQQRSARLVSNLPGAGRHGVGVYVLCSCPRSRPLPRTWLPCATSHHRTTASSPPDSTCARSPPNRVMCTGRAWPLSCRSTERLLASNTCRAGARTGAGCRMMSARCRVRGDGSWMQGAGCRELGAAHRSLAGVPPAPLTSRAAPRHLHCAALRCAAHLHDALLPSCDQQLAVLAERPRVCLVLEPGERAAHAAAGCIVDRHLGTCISAGRGLSTQHAGRGGALAAAGRSRRRRAGASPAWSW